MAGKKYSEVLNTMVSWTDAKRAEIQEKLRYGAHHNRCKLSGSKAPSNPPSEITYPNIEEEYQPEDQCIDNNSSAKKNLTINFAAIIIVLKFIM